MTFICFFSRDAFSNEAVNLDNYSEETISSYGDTDTLCRWRINGDRSIEFLEDRFGLLPGYSKLA